jgi:glutathione synthase/RimK-type ligase-like ATP-grasp enzyme
MILNKYILLIVYFFGLLAKVSWLKLFRLKTKGSKNIIWVYQLKSGSLRNYFIHPTFLNDMALIQAFVDSNINFDIRVGFKIGDASGKNIFYSLSKDYNVFGLANHSATLINVVEELEKQNNVLFPSFNELKFWENKSFMHRKFDTLKINCPKTWIISKPQDLEPIKGQIKFPCLLKECNSSGAAGIFEVKDFNSLLELVNEKNRVGKYEFLIQLLINMRKDLRVIVVGEEIVLHYWRINESKGWKPTSTGHGSKVDFISFPDQWKEEIVRILKTLELRTGAFDITWENDDVDTVPIILEVSPSYAPNPPLPFRWKDIPYNEFKKKLLIRNSYPIESIEIVFKIKRKLIDLYFKDLNYNI